MDAGGLPAGGSECAGHDGRDGVAVLVDPDGCGELDGLDDIDVVGDPGDVALGGGMLLMSALVVTVRLGGDGREEEGSDGEDGGLHGCDGVLRGCLFVDGLTMQTPKEGS